jgi:hypothetical protein
MLHKRGLETGRLTETCLIVLSNCLFVLLVRMTCYRACFIGVVFRITIWVVGVLSCFRVRGIRGFPRSLTVVLW